MTMIERMARAIWEARQAHCLREYPGLPPLEDWGDGSIPRSNGIYEEARAALDAMRIPTRGMVAAGDAVLGEFMVAESGCYHVMIDAARREAADAEDFAAAASILDAAEVPTENRLTWDGEKFISDNQALADKANGKTE